ncbi:unnamed protein product [Meganyctiphanes norvegica]|uniref:Uncharacterized protein n=1 Tax=Meganyctiphanes norvegica TaxID=48144 RepID=A0AAV2R198_MEGNR
MSLLHCILCFSMLPPSKTLLTYPRNRMFVMVHRPLHLDCHPIAFSFLGLPPKDCNVSKSIASGLLIQITLSLVNIPYFWPLFLGSCHPKTAILQSSFHLNCYPNFLVLGQHLLLPPKDCNVQSSLHLDFYPNYLVFGQHLLLPPKDCIASKFIASGLQSKLPCPWSTPLVATQRLQCSKFITFGLLSKFPCPWSTPLVATQRLQCSKFTASVLLSKFPRPLATPLTFGRPSTFIVSGVLSGMFH